MYELACLDCGKVYKTSNPVSMSCGCHADRQTHKKSTESSEGPSVATYSIAEDCQAVVSVEVIRKKLQELSLHSPLIRRVFDMADAQGMSEDDKMVMLAFHAVAMHERLQEKFFTEVKNAKGQKDTYASCR